MITLRIHIYIPFYLIYTYIYWIYGEEAILLLYTYMHINSDDSIRACMYRCVHTYTYAHNIYLYIYTKLSMCDVQRVRGAERSRTCCIKCRCCSLKKEKKIRKPHSFFWIVSGGTSVHRSAARAQLNTQSQSQKRKRNKRREITRFNNSRSVYESTCDGINAIEKLSRETHHWPICATVAVDGQRNQKGKGETRIKENG